MAITLAFDVYGTLIDTAGVAALLEEYVGGQSAVLADLWRTKQLEYSFRRGLMQDYQAFPVCTQQALDYACAFFHVELHREKRQALMEAYRSLPAFPDAQDGLIKLKSAGYRMFAFSNGRTEDIDRLLRGAGMKDHFEGVISVDDIKTFKPSPAVYAHFLRRSRSIGAETWLISSNPFDVIGAVSAGMRAAWVQRSPEALFDPWEIGPTVTVRQLTDLPDVLDGGGE